MDISCVLPATVPLLPASLADALSLGGGDLDLTNPALLALLSGAGIAVPGVGSGSGDEDDALIARDQFHGFFWMLAIYQQTSHHFCKCFDSCHCEDGCHSNCLGRC